MTTVLPSCSTTSGVDQVVIRSGADIVNIEHLDQKLWVALACPTRGLEIASFALITAFGAWLLWKKAGPPIALTEGRERASPNHRTLREKSRCGRP